MSQGVDRLNRGGGRQWIMLAFWLAVVAAVALVGSSVTLAKIPTWYAGLAKPSFTPPNSLFGPVWTVLYVMMALAAWRIGAASDAARTRAVALFAVQLALNAIWSPVFFGLEAPKLALAVITAFDVFAGSHPRHVLADRPACRLAARALSRVGLLCECTQCRHRGLELMATIRFGC